MSNIVPFSYENKQVRIIEKDGEPWFVAKDVCEVLELDNNRQALTRLDEDEKADVILNDGNQNRTFSIVNEAGLYSLILGSRKAEAKLFKRWITHEVIPSIRKTGQYLQKPVSALDALQQTVLVLTEQQKKLDKLQEQVNVQQQVTQTIKETIILTPDDWRNEINKMLNSISFIVGQAKFGEIRSETYKLLEKRAGASLDKRVMNIKARLLEQGKPKTAINKICKLDVIESDKKLKEIYTQIVKEYYIKYAA